MLTNMVRSLAALLLLISVAHAQFQFFEQMFGGGQGQQAPEKNVPSDSSRYQSMWKDSRCDRYLCPETLACVHFPHHCPCPFTVEEKFELGEGSAICVSKGGYRPGEAARKVELARKGLL
ncbi:hypothetical protein BDW59DRAFT_145582 [Aspergillus cavernicola]|uniref:Long chronological lifespan protein 2 n=1 Tax=Aspergillus cavernicola TaxID=176166 RepID=A0ABR4IE49_9EURO